MCSFNNQCLNIFFPSNYFVPNWFENFLYFFESSKIPIFIHITPQWIRICVATRIVQLFTSHSCEWMLSNSKCPSNKLCGVFYVFFLWRQAFLSWNIWFSTFNLWDMYCLKLANTKWSHDPPFIWICEKSTNTTCYCDCGGMSCVWQSMKAKVKKLDHTQWCYISLWWNFMCPQSGGFLSIWSEIVLSKIYDT